MPVCATLDHPWICSWAFGQLFQPHPHHYAASSCMVFNQLLVVTTQCPHALCEGLTSCLPSASAFLKMCWRPNVFTLEAQEQVMPCGDKFSPVRAEADGCVLLPFFSRKIVPRSSHWYSHWKDRPTGFSKWLYLIKWWLVWNYTFILPYYFSLGGIFKAK